MFGWGFMAAGIAADVKQSANDSAAASIGRLPDPQAASP